MANTADYLIRLRNNGDVEVAQVEHWDFIGDEDAYQFHGEDTSVLLSVQRSEVTFIFRKVDED